MKRLPAWICLVVLPAAAACGEANHPAALAEAIFSSFSVRPPIVAAAALDQERGLVVRRLWVGSEPDFWASAPSPDGRYVSEVDWITGDLAVLDLLTGELRRVTDKGSWSEAVEWAEMSAFSPDGQHIAYVYWNEELWGYELRVIDVDGSNERAILPHRDGLEWISVDGWSHDGQVLATLYWQTGEKDPVEFSEIALISAETGEVRVLKTEHWFGTWNAGFSPDGRFIAYEVRNRQEGREDRDIVVLATDGSLDEVLVGGPADDQMMAWTPDGGGILLYSDRNFTKGIWRLPVRDGAPAGEPELVRADVWRAEPIGFAGSSFYYGVHLESPQVYTASIDVEGGRLLTGPVPVEEPSGSRTELGEWSPDGRYLAYARRGPGGARPAALVIRSIAGGEIRELEVKLRRIRQLWWAPDSRSLLLFASHETDPNFGLFRLELESGALSTVVEPGIFRTDQRLFPSPDRRTFYFSRWDPADRVSRIMAFSRRTLEETELATTRLMVFRLVVSPDGRTLAFGQADPATGANHLSTLPTAGGEVRELDVSGGPRLDGLGCCGWTPDGKFLVISIWNEAEDTVGLWRLPAAGGEPLLIAERPAGHHAGHLRLSPDGRRIAFGSGTARGEIWVMENIPGLPAELQARGPNR